MNTEYIFEAYRDRRETKKHSWLHILDDFCKVLYWKTCVMPPCEIYGIAHQVRIIPPKKGDIHIL
jgi:hypothetical protein